MDNNENFEFNFDDKIENIIIRTIYNINEFI